MSSKVNENFPLWFTMYCWLTLDRHSSQVAQAFGLASCSWKPTGCVAGWWLHLQWSLKGLVTTATNAVEGTAHMQIVLFPQRNSSSMKRTQSQKRRGFLSIQWINQMTKTLQYRMFVNLKRVSYLTKLLCFKAGCSRKTKEYQELFTSGVSQHQGLRISSRHLFHCLGQGFTQYFAHCTRRQED